MCFHQQTACDERQQFGSDCGAKNEVDADVAAAAEATNTAEPEIHSQENYEFHSKLLSKRNTWSPGIAYTLHAPHQFIIKNVNHMQSPSVRLRVLLFLPRLGFDPNGGSLASSCGAQQTAPSTIFGERSARLIFQFPRANHFFFLSVCLQFLMARKRIRKRRKNRNAGICKVSDPSMRSGVGRTLVYPPMEENDPLENVEKRNQAQTPDRLLRTESDQDGDKEGEARCERPSIRTRE